MWLGRIASCITGASSHRDQDYNWIKFCFGSSLFSLFLTSDLDVLLPVAVESLPWSWVLLLGILFCPHLTLSQLTTNIIRSHTINSPHMKETLPGLPGLPGPRVETLRHSQFQDLAWLHCVSSFIFENVFISVVWYTCVADWPVCEDNRGLLSCLACKGLGLNSFVLAWLQFSFKCVSGIFWNYSLFKVWLLSLQVWSLAKKWCLIW